MNIKTPIIGIPNWDWKKELIEYAINNPNIHYVDISDYCYECSRHKEILKLIDSKVSVSRMIKSKYYKYRKKQDKKHIDIMDKINRFKKLYRSIAKKGCLCSPIVTNDGCRLDGSHRLSILLHLNIKKCDINIVMYEDLFNKCISNKIRKKVIKYRKEIYKL